MDNIRDKYVGELIELITIDLSAIGGGTYNITNNKPALTFDGVTYEYTPCEVSGVATEASGGSNNPTLDVSNIERLLMGEGDLVGGIVIRIRTWAEYLDGAPGADPTKRYPPDAWKIAQLSNMTRAHVSLNLINEIDSPESQLSRRVMLREDFPGLRSD